MDISRLIAAYNHRIEAAAKAALRQKRIYSTKLAAKVIVGNLIIIGVIVVYSFVGAYLFMVLEQPNEKQSCITRASQYNSDEQVFQLSILLLLCLIFDVQN